MNTASLRTVAPAVASKIKFSPNDNVWHLTLDQVEPDTGKIIKPVFAPAVEAGGSTHHFDENNVLYSKLRPYLNKVVCPDRPGIATTELVPLQPDPARLDRHYLCHYLRSQKFVNWISGQVAGAKMPRVSMKILWEHKIPLPSLPDQRRIAAILNRADALRRKRRESIALLEEFLRATFLDMFGDPVTNPKGWPVKKLAKTSCMAPHIGTIKPAHEDGSQLVVRVGELGNRFVNLSRCGKITLEDQKFDRFKLQLGDILLARAIGSQDHLGKASIFQGAEQDVIFDSHVMRLRFNKTYMYPEFFLQWLTSHGGRARFMQKAGRTAVQFNINAKQLADIDIPLPPVSIQEKFMRKVKNIFSLTEKYEQSYDSLDAQFNALVQRAFKGEL
jgi:type I restriction enzyme S subunit